MNANNNTELGTLYICDRDGNNAEPLNANDEPYSRDYALTAELDEPGVTLREATAADVHERYIDLCRDYILRAGYASDDGVSASVEVDATAAIVDEINAHPELHAEEINGLVEIAATKADELAEPIEDYVRRICGDDLFRRATMVARDNDRLSMEVIG